MSRQGLLKITGPPATYTAMQLSLDTFLRPTTSYFPPNVKPSPPLSYSKAISSTAGSAKPGFMIGHTCHHLDFKLQEVFWLEWR